MSLHHDSALKICSVCVLPETFPGIRFNEAGVCSHCQGFTERRAAQAGEKEEYRSRFHALLASLSRDGRIGRGSYDVLMAYSGGKDSTYTMALLAKRYGLRVLAVSLDNGFLSGCAADNIRRATEGLGVDHLFFKPRWDLLKTIFRVSAERELYAPKSLERASTICTSCMGLVKSVCMKTAIEMDIPLIGYGWSPGQAPLHSALMRNNPSLVRRAQEAVRAPLRAAAGSGVDAYFLDDRHYALAERFPYNVHPMAWEPYSEERVLDGIRKLGWTVPSDTDSNSTNCLLNAYANELHLKRYRFHPYAMEIASLVRAGEMERAEGYRKIYGAQPEGMVRAVREKLGAVHP
ncbi:MAG: hypothetical protein U0411_12905 [Thermodesulfovibrionales bacterium]